MSDPPRFPWHTLFGSVGCLAAAVAVLSIWALPIALPFQVLVTAVVVVVPSHVVVFFLGRKVEHWAQIQYERGCREVPPEVPNGG